MSAWAGTRGADIRDRSVGGRRTGVTALTHSLSDPDAPCPECGGDAFGCSCEPVGEVFTADDVRQAVAVSDAKRAKAVADARIAAGLVKDLQARIAELEATAPARVPAWERHGQPKPVGNDARRAAGRAELARLAAAEERVVAEVAHEVGVRPARLVKYLGDLVDPPRIAYAQALAAWLCGEADAVEPAPVDAEWFGRVDAKVRRFAS